MVTSSNDYGLIKPAERYSSTDTCAVCLESLSLNTYRLGVTTIHTKNGGDKHPLHKICFYKAVEASGCCPVCRISIPKEAFKTSFSTKLLVISSIFASVVTYQFLMSYLTNSPKLSAAIPGLISAGAATKNLYTEYKNLELETSLKRAIIIDVGQAVLTIALPIFAAALAEKTTDSLFQNSCITTAITMAGILTFIKLMTSSSTPRQRNTWPGEPPVFHAEHLQAS